MQWQLFLPSRAGPLNPRRLMKRPRLGEMLQQLLFLTTSFGTSLSRPSSGNFHSRNPVCWKLPPLISQVSQGAPFLSLTSHPSSLLSLPPCLVQGGHPHGETEDMLFRKDISSWQPAHLRDLAVPCTSSNCNNRSQTAAITITTAYVSPSQQVLQQINLKCFSLADCI